MPTAGAIKVDIPVVAGKVSPTSGAINVDIPVVAEGLSQSTLTKISTSENQDSHPLSDTDSHHRRTRSAPPPKVPPPANVSTPTGWSLDAINHGAIDGNELHIYAPEEFEVKTYGFAGQIVQKMGIWAYMLFFVIPLAYVAIFFAIVPLGDPVKADIDSQWVFLFISNVCVMLAVAYLYNAAFLALADCARPFRTSVIPLIAVVLAEIGVMTPIMLVHGSFPWIGIVALGTCYFALFFSMFLAYPDLRNILHSFFRRFMTLLILYIPLLCGYVIAYRETSSNEVQAALAFAFALGTFIYRRIMLSRLDPFPLDSSQLFSGFWVQNLGDCTQILAFPQVSSPKVYGALFFANSFANVAFLVFVSDPWIFKIRPVLKTYVKESFKCNFPIPPIPKPDFSFDPVNRGHDNNVGGYRRRQFRFFFFRLLSQAVAMVMYLGISPMLRYGLNDKYTPLSVYKFVDYRNSMIYAASNLGFIVFVAVFGYVYLSKRHHQTFEEIREIHFHDFVHHTKVGLVTTIITHNLILTMAIILSHYCIYSSSNSCVVSPPKIADTD